jgi:PEP-CTERM motif
MGRLLKSVVVTAMIAVACLPGTAGAAVVFSDNFDAEPGGSQLNYNAFANWNVADGTVDLIASGGFGITCVGGAGKCVDMDGSTSDAGRLESKTTFNLTPGDYVLTFSVSGNQRGGSADSMSFGFGSFTDSIVDLASDAPFATHNLFFTVASNTSGTIFFDHAGGDNIGIILDSVVLESRQATPGVPEPSTLLLLGAGIVGLGAWVRRRP